jgi:hypothetical protein
MKEIVRQIGHQSIGVHVYSHPRLGVAATLTWDVYKGSTNVRTKPQCSYTRDASLKGWPDALDIMEQLIGAARRQLELLDLDDE